MSKVVIAALFGLALSAHRVVGAEPCVWGPFRDVAAAQRVLDEWVAEAGMPAFDKAKSGLGVDRGSARLTLQFSSGALVFSWHLDERCQPTAITIDASPDYLGAQPGNSAVAMLIEKLRTLTEERRSPSAWTRFSILQVGLGAAALVMALFAMFGRRADVWARTARLPSAAVRWLKDMPVTTRLRYCGMVTIFLLLPFEPQPVVSGSLGSWALANVWVLLGVWPFISVLWLAFSGHFGFASPRRADWPAVLVVGFALLIREGFARHGVEGIELHFLWDNSFDRHSVVYTFYVMFLQSLGGDPYNVVIHANAILGAAATLPLYLFARQRTGNPTAALAVALLYSVHPILVQMAPTDAPYSLCFATWFMGLALLTADEIGARELIGGATLLGIAATCRAEGGLYLPASLLLIDVLALLRAVRRQPAAAAIGLVVLLGLLAVEIYFVFSGHIGSTASLPVDVFSLKAALKAAFYSTDYNDPVIVGLFVVGALAGLVGSRLRLGLGAVLATLVVVWPFCGTTLGGYIILHRLSPACALQVVAAGVGIAWLASWVPARLRHPSVMALPALAVAFYLLFAHWHEIHDPTGLSDEFWMLRNHLAPGGVVNRECKLVWVGRAMDTDLHNFEQVLPGMAGVQCQQVDCLAEVAKGGCFYYMRGLNCFHTEKLTTRECLQHGKTPGGGYFDCIHPECVRVERALKLELIEQRTVDVHAVWNFERGQPPDPWYPFAADVGLYRVLGLKENDSTPRSP